MREYRCSGCGKLLGSAQALAGHVRAAHGSYEKQANQTRFMDKLDMLQRELEKLRNERDSYSEGVRKLETQLYQTQKALHDTKQRLRLHDVLGVSSNEEALTVMDALLFKNHKSGRPGVECPACKPKIDALLRKHGYTLTPVIYCE